MPVYTLDTLHLILLYPLLGFLLNGILGRMLGRAFVNWTAVLVMVASAWQSTLTVFQLYKVGWVDGVWHGARLTEKLFTWFSAGDLTVDVTFMVDPLTAVMILIITWVGMLIHLYSVAYMAHEDGFWRYFAYLNLFIFSMLILVMGKSLVLMFVGWEGVGLCSYLLIGYWFEDPAKAGAGLKAFVVNRVGDFGFLLGMFTLMVIFGTLDTVDLETKVAALTNLTDALNTMGPLAGLTVGGGITLAVLCLFLGATGKSAQIPLYVWLPDAMAGPTPVSALIHAATMVTAGVYMLSRLNFLVVLSPVAMGTIAVVGGLTALVAATIGFAQTDIKKVLAYSTVSQLGYMFLGAGVGAFVASIFHLMTHAFFKACLFLGSGSVIHGMGGEQDMRKMGGLRKYMPTTRATFMMATLAIMGFPLTSGFMSKDEILWWSFASERGHIILWLVGALAAAGTSFYMWRCYFMTFSGEGRMDEHTRQHAHESPWQMTVPLVLLGTLALAGGFLGVPELLGEPVAQLMGAAQGLPAENVAYHGNLLLNWLQPVYQVASAHPLTHGLFHETAALAHKATLGEHPAMLEWGLMGTSVLLALLAWAVARALYYPEPSPALTTLVKGGFGPIYRGALNKWYVDETYNAVILRPIRWISERILTAFDRYVMDGLLTGLPPSLVGLTGRAVARLQNGDLQRYLIFIVAGVALALVYLAR